MAADFPSMSDEELARETQAGSLVAFEELVRRYEGRIYGFVFQYCRNQADAAEITQDSFVRAFQAIAQFVPRGGFGSWLFTIARRKCIDHYRTTLRTTGEEAMPELADHNDPAALLARQEAGEQLWTLARKHLRETQYQALWLRYAEDMSIEGVARVLRKTQTHVKVLLFRARETLRRELKLAQVSSTPGGPSAPRTNAGVGDMFQRTCTRVDRLGAAMLTGFAAPALIRQSAGAKKGIL
jgi:RNA polymerase sigma-70 factor (ECF subfamily)